MKNSKEFLLVKWKLVDKFLLFTLLQIGLVKLCQFPAQSKIYRTHSDGVLCPQLRTAVSLISLHFTALIWLIWHTRSARLVTALCHGHISNRRPSRATRHLAVFLATTLSAPPSMYRFHLKLSTFSSNVIAIFLCSWFI